MRRYELSDDEWNRIEHLLPGRVGDPGGHGEDNRLFVNAVIWIARSGAPWRRSAGAVRALEFRVSTLQSVGEVRRVGTGLRSN